MLILQARHRFLARISSSRCFSSSYSFKVLIFIPFNSHVGLIPDSMRSQTGIKSRFVAALSAASGLCVRPPKKNKNHNRVLKPAQSSLCLSERSISNRSKSDWFVLWGWTRVYQWNHLEDFGSVKKLQTFWLHMAHKGPGRCEGVLRGTRTQQKNTNNTNVLPHF